MSQPIRTLGALALGASIVAIAALSVRTGPVAGAADDPPAKTITVSATGKVTVVPDVARVYLGVTVGKPTVKAAREAGAKAMTDILAALKGLGIADKRHPDDGPQPVAAVRQRIPAERRRVPDQRADRGHRARPRQGRRRGRHGDGPGRHRHERHLVRGVRPGQGPERRPCSGRRRRPDERPGAGEGRQRLARGRRLDHRRVGADPAPTVCLRRRDDASRPTRPRRSSPGRRTWARRSRWCSRSADPDDRTGAGRHG